MVIKLESPKGPPGPSRARKGAAAPGKRAAAAALKLFWCTTPDHDEDWFIIATSPASAERSHAIEEGYDVMDVDAEYVCDVPTGVEAESPVLADE